MKKLKKLMLLIAAVSTIMGMSAQAATPKLNKTKVSVGMGCTQTLKVSNYKGTVKWSTSNKKVATVSTKGVVKGVASGKTTITAKCGAKNLKCSVTVKKASLSKKSVTVNVGKTVKLAVKNGKASKWKSANTSIATVKSGTVKGVKAGKTKITCTVGGKTLSCNVTVKASSNNTSSTPSVATNQANAKKYFSGGLTITKQSDCEKFQKLWTASIRGMKNSRTEIMTKSSDDNVVSTDGYNVLTANGNGKCIIYIMAYDKTMYGYADADSQLPKNISVTKFNVTVNIKGFKTVKPRKVYDLAMNIVEANSYDFMTFFRNGNIKNLTGVSYTGIKQCKGYIYKELGDLTLDRDKLYMDEEWDYVIYHLSVVMTCRDSVTGDYSFTTLKPDAYTAKFTKKCSDEDFRMCKTSDYIKVWVIDNPYQDYDKFNPYTRMQITATSPDGETITRTFG